MVCKHDADRYQRARDDDGRRLDHAATPSPAAGATRAASAIADRRRRGCTGMFKKLFVRLRFERARLPPGARAFNGMQSGKLRKAFRLELGRVLGQTPKIVKN